MPLNESDIKIIIAAELKKQSFEKAEKATKILGKSFDRLAGRIGAALSIAAVVKFSKAAITAFAEDEKAAKSLTRTFENVGLAFQGAIVNDYVDQLQRATGVADTELRPALATLTRATLDYNRAQDLLGTAMNVSAGTGLSLETVTNALAKAQLGQMTSLAKLNVGIGKAEASTISFDDALIRINQRFGGQAAIAANSYEGQLKRLRIQADEAQESLGKDLVLAINRLTNSGNLSSLGNKFEDMADNAGKMAIGIADIIGQLNRDVSASGADGWITKFNDLMAKINVFEYLKERGQLVAMGVKERTLGAPGAQMKATENAKLLAAERAELAKIIALEKARLKEQAKQKRLREISKMLTEKEAKFDLQRIQLAAAAQGKLTEEEKKRVAEMQLIEEIKTAIAAEDLDRTEKLLKRLEEVKNLTYDVAQSLLDLKPGNPFSEWTKTLTTVTDQLIAIATKKIVVDFLANFTPTSTAAITSPSASSAAIAAITSPAATAASSAQAAKVAVAVGDAAVAAAQAATAVAEAATATTQAAEAVATATTPEEKAAASAAVIAAEAATQAAVILTESAAAVEAIAASAAVTEAETLLAISESVANILDAEAAAIDASLALIDATSLFDYSGLAAMAAGVPSTEIYVTVEGSVTSAEDLAEVITDIQYNYQRTGKGLLLQSRAI